MGDRSPCEQAILSVSGQIASLQVDGRPVMNTVLGTVSNVAAADMQ
jgi:hypothetical protein